MKAFAISRRPHGFKAFLHDTHGSVAIIFAFCVVFLTAFVGGAVDFARVYKAQAAYSDALDAASLAGARAKQLGASDADAILAAEAYLAQTRVTNPADGKVVFKVVDGGTAIQAEANLALKTNFLAATGISKVDFKVKNTAQFSDAPDVEMSLMLDVTGSMGGQKIIDLKAAVEDLMDIVIKDNPGTSVSRIGLAPFSSSVKLKNAEFEAATGRSSSGAKRCIVERAGEEAYTDAAPGAGRFVTPIEDVSGGNCANAKEVFGLSNKKSELKKMVKELSAGGSTAGHIGTAWAWYLLSPHWSGVFDASAKPAPYEDLTLKKPNGMPKLRKIAVLMTDGEYNTQYLNEDSTTQARSICANLKHTGIEVFTVGFQVGDLQSAIDTLQGCATAPSNFYNTANGDDLRAAFRDIALKASTLRLSR